MSRRDCSAARDASRDRPPGRVPRALGVGLGGGLLATLTACAQIAGLDQFVDETGAGAHGSGAAGAHSGSGAQGQGGGAASGGTGGVQITWVERFAGGFDELQPRLALAPSGATVLAGFFEQEVTFDHTLTSAGYRDLFVAQLNPAGVPVWSKAFGDSKDQCESLDLVQCNLAVAVDSQGNVVIAGRFEGTVDLGAGPLTANGTNGDILLAKLGPDGAIGWSKSFSSPDQQDANALAIDAQNNIIVAGDFLGSVDLGGGSLQSAGERDVLLAKLGPDGKHQWSKRGGDAQDQCARSVAVDGSGNLVVAGRFIGQLDLGGGALSSSEPVSAGNPDVFVAKLAPDGSHQWSKRYGDGKYQDAFAVAVGPDGAIVVVGSFDQSIDFGKTELVAVGARDMYLAKLHADGTELWSKRIGTTGSVYPTGVAVGAQGRIAVTGYFDGSIDLGGGPLTADEGSNDAFLALYDAAGELLFGQDAGDYSTEQGNAAAFASSGDVLFAGSARGQLALGQFKRAPLGSHDVFVVRAIP